MITGFDDFVLVVTDLERAVAEHVARGFTVTPGGEHADGLTHNALVRFSDGSGISSLLGVDMRVPVT